jgi:glycosyltransferase involved in cell wall biosynthesis
MGPKITTIIPTYQRPQLLERAVMSVLNQTYSDFQLCIYDNASNDETPQVVDMLKKQDSRVKYHCHSENIGMIGNYKYAISKIETPFFSLLSDDDIYFPWFYESALQGFEEFPEAGFSAVSAIAMNEKGKVISVPLSLWKREGKYLFPEGLLELPGKFPVPMCILFRREVLDEIEIDTTNQLLWDCDFLMQIAARFPFYISKKPGGIFLQHPSSYSFSQDLTAWKTAVERLKMNIQNFESLALDVKNALLRRIACFLRDVEIGHAVLNFYQKRFAIAHQMLKNCLDKGGYNFVTFTFLIWIKVCLFIPPAFLVILGLKKCRRLLKRKSSLKEYEKYSYRLLNENPSKYENNHRYRKENATMRK